MSTDWADISTEYDGTRIDGRYMVDALGNLHVDATHPFSGSREYALQRYNVEGQARGFLVEIYKEKRPIRSNTH